MKSARRKSARNTKLAVGATTIARLDAKSFLNSGAAGHSSGKYRPKQAMMRQGDAADAVYYIKKGKVRLSVISEHGKEATIALLGAGKFFGEGCLAGQPLNLASAVAVATSTVVRIDKETMIRALHEQPKLSEMFRGFLLSRNVQAQADLVDQLFNSSERRLARLLLLLGNFGKEGKMATVIPKISQDALAVRVGTTRARINFFMKKFRKLGLIEYDGGSSLKGGSLKVHTSLLNVIVHD